MDEKEYIERRTAINIVLNAAKDWATAYYELNNIPAADVQEVKRGKWESTELMFENGCTRCSNCKTEFYMSSLDEVCGDMFPTFCPCCGARMDGEENGNL